MPKPTPAAATADRPTDAGAPGSATESTIRTHVIGALGQPPGLYRVVVLPLWDRHYRVNVLVGADPTALTIAHSFFVKSNEAGSVLSSVPHIARQYT